MKRQTAYKTYGDYNGKKLFTVTHPDHSEYVVASAPDEVSAIVTAAEYWGEKWTRYSFYAFCRVAEGDLTARAKK